MIAHELHKPASSTRICDLQLPSSKIVPHLALGMAIRTLVVLFALDPLITDVTEQLLATSARNHVILPLLPVDLLAVRTASTLLNVDVGTSTET